MINTCLKCGVITKNKKYCSHTCSNLHKWDNPEYRKKQTINSRKTWSSKVTKDKVSNSLKSHWKNNENRHAILNKINSTRWSNLENRINHSSRMKDKWADPSYKDKVSKAIKHSHRNPEILKKISEASKRFWTSEKRENHSSLLNELYCDINYIDKVFRSSKKYKTLILPSGKEIRVQGYENLAILHLLKSYTEEDLIIGPKHIHDSIGTFVTYSWNKSIRKYFPDIYLKSENRIIEVKSTYTFNINELNCYAKKDACIRLGFNFSFMIIDIIKHEHNIIFKNYSK